MITYVIIDANHKTIAEHLLELRTRGTSRKHDANGLQGVFALPPRELARSLQLKPFARSKIATDALKHVIPKLIDDLR